MRGIRTAGISLATALALSAALAASASGSEYEIKGLPELGRCVAVAKRTGEFTGSHCLGVANGKGNYDWFEGPGAKKKFSGTAKVTSLETVGKRRVECAGSTFKGEYTAPKGENLTVTLTGCVEPASGKHCQSSPISEGTIESEALEGELGFIKGQSTKSPVAGWDLKPKSPATSLMTFECGKFPETLIHEAVEGSVIGSVLPPNHMVKLYKLSFKVLSGKQSPEHFETGPKDTLSTTFTSGVEKTVEPTVLRAAPVAETEEALEIKEK